MSKVVEHPVALITGASRGIGAAAALRFAELGYHVAMVARDCRKLMEVSEKVQAQGVESLPINGDLSDLTFAESAVASCIAKWGRIDVLVNNAAWREIITMRTISLESWEKTLRVCLTTPAFLARWAAEHMQQRRSGAIVNISSIMSKQAAGISPAYVACKGAIDSLTYELASLYGHVGIRVVGINLGAITTDLNRDYAISNQADSSDALRQVSEDMIMLRRWADPNEIARCIAWLASEDASYITGTNVMVDGGWMHQHFPLSFKQQHFQQLFPKQFP